MAATTITWDTKVQGLVNPAPDIEKFTYLNAEAVKAGINDHATRIDLAETNLDNSTATQVVVKGQTACQTVPITTPTGTTATINWNNGNFQVLELGSATGDVTLSFSNPITAAPYVLKIIQSSTARNITFPTILWINKTAITLTTTDDAVDIITFLYDGTNYYGSYGNNYGIPA